MARKTSPVPKGYRTITPQLTVRFAAEAIEFYKDAFGAEELTRAYGADGATVINAELKIGNSIFRLNDEMPAYGLLSPLSLGGTHTAVHMYLPEVDDVWARAVEAGATVIVPLADTYWGERFGKLVDPFGQVWSFAKRIEALTPAEIAARAQQDIVAVEESFFAGYGEEIEIAEGELPTVGNA